MPVLLVFLIFLSCKQEDSNSTRSLDEKLDPPSAATNLVDGTPTTPQTPGTPSGQAQSSSTPSTNQPPGDTNSQDPDDTNSQDPDDTDSQDPNDTDSQDANTSSPNSTLTKYYKDSDLDTYGDPNTFQMASEKPAGYVTNNTDCNDFHSDIFPGAEEVCGDAIDQDCDGVDPNVLYDDLDQDSYGDPNGNTREVTESNCLLSTLSLNKLDCNDSDPNINPETSWYEDSDEDGLGLSTGNVIYTQCKDPSTDTLKYASNNLDPNDNIFNNWTSLGDSNSWSTAFKKTSSDMGLPDGFVCPDDYSAMNLLNFYHATGENQTDDESVQVKCINQASLGTSFSDLISIDSDTTVNKCSWTAWDLKLETCNNCNNSTQPSDLDTSTTSSATNASVALCESDEVMSGLRYYSSSTSDGGTHEESISILCCETPSQASISSCTWGSSNPSNATPVQWTHYETDDTGLDIASKGEAENHNLYQCQEGSVFQGLAFSHQNDNYKTWQEWVNIYCCDLYE